MKYKIKNVRFKDGICKIDYEPQVQIDPGIFELKIIYRNGTSEIKQITPKYIELLHDAGQFSHYLRFKMDTSNIRHIEFHPLNGLFDVFSYDFGGN